MSMIEKVRALLAKAERTDNEHESAIFFAKAEELIVKYAIDEAALAPEDREKFVQRTVGLSPKAADWLLLNAICLRHAVKFVKSNHRIKGSNNKQRHGWLFGTESDIAFVEALYASLLVQRERELSRAEQPAWEHGKAFNSSFRTHYAGRIGQRLDEWTSAAKAAHPGSELVLYDKSAARTKMAEDALGTLRNTTGPRTTSAYGALAGREAANRANISGGERNLGGHRRALTS